MTPKLKPEAEELMRSLVEESIQAQLKAAGYAIRSDDPQINVQRNDLLVGMKLALSNLPKLLEADTNYFTKINAAHLRKQPVAIVEVEWDD